MSLLDAVRAAVRVANTVTKPLQTLVTYEQDLGADVRGTRTFAAPALLHAIVDFRSQMVRTRDGQLTATRSTVTLLNLVELVAATNGKGVGQFDRFTFPDGETGPILGLSGFVDPGTGQPIATTVMIG